LTLYFEDSQKSSKHIALKPIIKHDKNQQPRESTNSSNRRSKRKIKTKNEFKNEKVSYPGQQLIDENRKFQFRCGLVEIS